MRSLILRKVAERVLPVMLMVLTAVQQVYADSGYVDDGRYDYGLSQPDIPGMIIEYDSDIPVSDGTILKGDIFRPDAPGTYPVIMAQGPFPRQMDSHLGVDDNGGVSWDNWYFEQANPNYWVPRGYIYISFSTRGYGGSEGDTVALDYQEFTDFYDAIEWAAAQPWCNGNVGLYGISYYAFTQYFVAGLNPPHLKVAVPWEGLADPYRDIAYRGGIPCTFGFMFSNLLRFTANHPRKATNYTGMYLDYPLMDPVWMYGANVYGRPEGSTPMLLDVLKDIEVPMLSVGNLNDPDLHLRGNVYAFREADSPNKKLLLYTGTHWGSAAQPWANRTVLRFLDHYLKGIDTGIENEPSIDIQLRTASDTFTHVYGDSWPLEQTQWTKYYLQAGSKGLSTNDTAIESSVKATWHRDGYTSGDQVSFLTEPLQADVQIAGPLSAHFWVSTSEDDVDLIVELRDFDEEGNETRFAYYQAGQPDEPVTRGWLRASLRALDPVRTLPHQPFFTYAENDWLTPDVPVPVDVELWPSSMVFKAGHRMGVTIFCGRRNMHGEAVLARDVLPNSTDLSIDLNVAAYQTFSPDAGTVHIYTGGDKSSWLDLPVIPADPAPTHSIAITDEAYEPAVVIGRMGDRFEWTNKGEGYHTATGTGLSPLWDSQLINGLRSHNPETWWVKIQGAGTYAYRDRVSGFVGVIEIPNRIIETLKSSSSVSVEVCADLLPEGIGTDVQLQSGKEAWQTVYEGTRLTVVTFSGLESGSYAVRSRLKRLDDSRTVSDWSPATSFKVE